MILDQIGDDQTGRPRDPRPAVHEHTPPLQSYNHLYLTFVDLLGNLIKIHAHVLALDIVEFVLVVPDGGVVLDCEPGCGGDDCVHGLVPTRMLFFLSHYRS